MKVDRDEIAQAELRDIVAQLADQEWVPKIIPAEFNGAFMDNIGRLIPLMGLLGPLVVAIMLATRMFWVGVRYGQVVPTEEQ